MAQALGTASPFTLSGGLQFELIIGVIVIYGVVRGLSGRKFSRARVIRTPLIYAVLTVVAVFLTSIPNIDAKLMVLLLPAGIPFGVRFGKDVKFFTKNGVLYYRRSPLILLLWAFALIARVSLELFSSGTLIAIIAINAILSFITGILLGEAVHILTRKNEAPMTEDMIAVNGTEGK